MGGRRSWDRVVGYDAIPNHGNIIPKEDTTVARGYRAVEGGWPRHSHIYCASNYIYGHRE